MNKVELLPTFCTVISKKKDMVSSKRTSYDLSNNIYNSLIDSTEDIKDVLTVQATSNIVIKKSTTEPFEYTFSPSNELAECCIRNSIEVNCNFIRNGRQRKQKKTYAYFMIRGDMFDPLQLAKDLDIVPVEHFRKGDKWLGNKDRFFSLLSICRKELGFNTIASVLDSIRGSLEDKVNVLAFYKEQYGLDYTVEVVWFLMDNSKYYDIYPNLKTMEFFRKIGADYDYDVYYY